MTILLDENFPLRLYRRLRQQGRDVQHIIELGQRGISDADIRRRLQDEELLFLTNDTEFLVLPFDCQSTILLSRVSQSLPLEERVTLWLSAIDQFFAQTWTEQLFEVGNDGILRPISKV
ncbi:MAG: DUF5615 family PIN-like protein [Abditibacteriales bacterium]|nr:DUF5615 family PIN-like protein [Abditibacteriales bacterium]MDW8365366.1 DUF5615 family PIN-like protein [Abditibacteriales bacterium]